MAVTFLDYLDERGEGASGRRMMFLCDSSADVSGLPTTQAEAEALNAKGEPLPGSMALVIGGDMEVLDSTGTWGTV